MKNPKQVFLYAAQFIGHLYFMKSKFISGVTSMYKYKLRKYSP